MSAGDLATDLAASVNGLIDRHRHLTTRLAHAAFAGALSQSSAAQDPYAEVRPALLSTPGSSQDAICNLIECRACDAGYELIE